MAAQRVGTLAVLSIFWWVLAVLSRRGHRLVRWMLLKCVTWTLINSPGQRRCGLFPMREV